MKLLFAVMPAAIIIAVALVMLWPIRAFAGDCGLASWYGSESGSRTANGEHFDGTSLTAASRTLPFGTKLRVSYQGRSVVVRINDRGPYVKGRFLDLSHAAASQIGLTAAGVGRVCVERLR